MELVLLACLAQEDGRFFKKGDVDFWNSKKPAVARSRSLWVEPVFGTDGRIQTHVPPPEVTEFLDAPTRENARRYLDWQRERTERLRKAMQVLAEVQAGEAAPAVYYFAKAGCPACEKQDRELGRMDVVRVPSDSPLWARFGVRVVPTIVVVRPGRVRAFEGFTPAADLAKEVGRDR